MPSVTCHYSIRICDTSISAYATPLSHALKLARRTPHAKRTPSRLYQGATIEVQGSPLRNQAKYILTGRAFPVHKYD